MSKKPPMKYKCSCGIETRLKPILLGFHTHCKKCGKEFNRDEVLADVEHQKLERK
ncbi:hypothetical protein [Clostridium sp. VAP23]|uniref:hypothetical protein n=1 Tax=Clostridium sp. VAP23 TaxID=2949981 RepID=UPI002079B9F0|nr:hypothetical protein [Clostridium sp. VAP23]